MKSSFTTKHQKLETIFKEKGTCTKFFTSEMQGITGQLWAKPEHSCKQYCKLANPKESLNKAFLCFGLSLTIRRKLSLLVARKISYQTRVLIKFHNLKFQITYCSHGKQWRPLFFTTGLAHIKLGTLPSQCDSILQLNFAVFIHIIQLGWSTATRVMCP